MAEETPVAALDDETRAAIRKGLDKPDAANSYPTRRSRRSGGSTAYEGS